MAQKKQLIGSFQKHGLIKHGTFTLKSGETSTIYFDLRTLVSFPELLQRTTLEIHKIAESEALTPDIVCGVPYGAISMASFYSTFTNTPLIIKRKEVKKYGTGKMVEGEYKENARCLLIEDVITSGKSLLETIEELERENIKIEKIVCILDRQEGGLEKIKAKGYNISALFTKEEVLSSEKDEKQHTFQKNISNRKAQELISICKKKKTNLAVAADYTKTKKILTLAEEVGENICLLKLHVDIIEDFSDSFIKQLKEIAQEKEFMIWEDRKFTDIGAVVKKQFFGGMYFIQKWADFVTANPLSGENVLDGFAEIDCGVILITEMSSVGNLMDIPYQYRGISMAKKHPHIVSGLVTQNNDFGIGDMLLFSPGVRIGERSDAMGQQYNSPQHLKKTIGTDIFIVGRGITEAKNKKEATAKYKEACWY